MSYFHRLPELLRAYEDEDGIPETPVEVLLRRPCHTILPNVDGHFVVADELLWKVGG